MSGIATRWMPTAFLAGALAASGLAACGGEEKPAAGIGEQASAAPSPRPDDAIRVGEMMARDGLLHDREVQAKMSSYVYLVNSRQMRQDSADAAFRAWLEDWVRRNPERVEQARRAQAPAAPPRPRAPTLDELERRE